MPARLLQVFDDHATAVCAHHYRLWAGAETSYDLTAETFARLAEHHPTLPDPPWLQLLTCSWALTAEALSANQIPDRSRRRLDWDLAIPAAAELRDLTEAVRTCLRRRPDPCGLTDDDLDPVWRHAQHMTRLQGLPADHRVPAALTPIRRALAATWA